MAAAARGHTFTEEELQFLQRVARGLEAPLREAAGALKAGQKVALLGVRTLPDGRRLLPGTPLHKAQRWVDYQFRHPEKYRRFSFQPDSDWERMYESILKNRQAGNAFEDAILQAGRYERTGAMMMPPPGNRAQGFIPDSVRGNPAELIWGQPYPFVEAKAHKELSLSGNLEAMIDYVEKYGGHLELWVRSTMPVKYLDLQIRLPPGRPSCELVRDLLELVFRRYRWFAPRRYGSASLKREIDPATTDLAPLVAYYEEHNNLMVAARTDRDFISIYPSSTGSPPYTGSISWMTSVTSASKASWRAAYAQQVAELMRLVQSPLALAGLDTDLHGKQRRIVHKSIPTESEKEFTYSEEELTVRDYSEGLPGLVWRNFYGPPFVRMFGKRLDDLPEECRRTLGEGLVLVQPYEQPMEAGTESGMARERELISLLGPECFYDHEHHTLPTRRPVLDSLGQPLH